MTIYLREGVDTGDAQSAIEAIADDLASLDTCETLEDARANIAAARASMATLATALDTCETLEDARANIAAARASMATLATALAELEEELDRQYPAPKEPP